MTCRLLQVLLLVVCSFGVGAEEHRKFFQLIDESADRITALTVQFEGAPDDRRRLFQTRLERAETQRTQMLHSFVESLAGNEEDPLTLEEQERLENLLKEEPVRIRQSLARIVQQVELPTRGLPASELAALSTQLENQLQAAGELHDALFRNIELSRQLGLAVEAESESLKKSTLNRAENASTYLDVVLEDTRGLEREAALLPDDQELQSLHRVQSKLLEVVIDELEQVTASLEELGEVDTTLYRSQIVSASGSLSQDVLDVGVFSTLIAGWMEKFAEWVGSNGINLVFNVLTFLAILLVSSWLSSWVRRAVEKALQLSNAKMSTLLHRMIVSTATSSVYVLGVLIAFSQVGLSLGPLLAGLGIAGFVIGFALQDTLSNFASGMMILFYRPFDVGDVIDSGGILGTVSEMSLVNTTILTFDYQTLIIPNSSIWGNVIKNVTAQRERRVDLVFGIGYGDDIPTAEAVIWDVLKQDERILESPETLVKVHELGESSVNIVVRPWVKTEDYWNVYWDLIRTIKMKFDENGITIPFPQRDVHIISQNE